MNLEIFNPFTNKSIKRRLNHGKVLGELARRDIQIITSLDFDSKAHEARLRPVNFTKDSTLLSHDASLRQVSVYKQSLADILAANPNIRVVDIRPGGLVFSRIKTPFSE